MSKKYEQTSAEADKALRIGSVRRSSDNWEFCNTELRNKTGYCSDYYCPKCGSESGMVNIIGLCATKVSR